MPKLIIDETNEVLAESLEYADTIFRRLKGLLGRSFLEKDQALLLKPCNSIHTFFMRFSIDVIFLDKELRVVKVLRNFPPNRLSSVYFSAFQAVELAAGTLQKKAVNSGIKLKILQ